MATEGTQAILDLAIPKEAQELVSQVENDLVVAQRFSIVSNENYAEVGEVLKRVKGRYQEIEAKRKEMTAPLDETKKRIMDFFRQPLDRLANAERAIKAEMVRFTQEQERLRKAEEERLQRLAQEEQRRRDEALQKQIDAAQERGDEQAAETLLQFATETAVPVVQVERPKVEGINVVRRWKYRVVDESLIPREYLVPNEKLLASIAVSSKGTAKIAGIEFYPEAVIASRTL